MISQGDIQQLFGTDVHESDGSKIGSTQQVYLDDATGTPEWVTVRTGLFGTKESFVPLEGATLNGDRIEVPFSKDQVKGAPRVIDPEGSLSPAEEDELYAYYGLASLDGRLTDSGTGTADAPVEDVPGAARDEVGRARMRRYVETRRQDDAPLELDDATRP